MPELRPEVEILLDEMEAQGLPDTAAVSVPTAREFLRDLHVTEEPVEQVASVDDVAIPGPAGEIPLRIYRPGRDGPYPVLVYFHGGGWVVGDLDTVDEACRVLANEVGCVVVSVDYRLAPEHPFPAAVEDCYAATEWVADNADALLGDPDRVAVAGDSAGGNLAASVSLAARNLDGPDLTHQCLIYPVTDHNFDTDSYHENAEDYFLTRDAMKWFWDHYLDSPFDGANPYASPLRADDCSDLPPATVMTCEFDPLRDEGEAYADRLEDAGVPVSRIEYDDMIHGFFLMIESPPLDAAREAVDDVAAELRAAFEE
jgi:acetyl esterase